MVRKKVNLLVASLVHLSHNLLQYFRSVILHRNSKMGLNFSIPINRTQVKGHQEPSHVESNKRMKMTSSSSYLEIDPRLIPYLPDEISLQILARVPKIHYLQLKGVSCKWKSALISSELFEIRKELQKTEEWLYILTHANQYKLSWHALDPISKIWQKLPPMPDLVCTEESKRVSSLGTWNLMGSSIRIADAIRSWLGRRDSLDRMPFCGCSIGGINGCLYVIGGFSRSSAMNCVYKYNPILNMWHQVTSMHVPRAFSKVSVLNDKLYVVGGVSRARGGLTPLQSAEVYNPEADSWSEIPNMPFLKAQILPTAFLAEMLKPIATGMTSYMGKLCVPQSLYSWPFFVDVGGEVYDPETDAWADMPPGMGEGWPAKQAGTKLSVVVNDELYALDPSNSVHTSKIKVYNQQEDMWKVVIDEVPLYDYTDTESPYLLASLNGKLHLIVKDASNLTSVLETDVKKNVAGEGSSEVEGEVWRVVGTKNFGGAELISCQVLDM